MNDRRYSVFISSTFEDLRSERQAVQDAVLSAGDFPVQMESFPAADEDQFEFIKTLIDKCDYYILIIAGRYGTQAADGMSFTEKEYHYAKSQKIPVLAMVHGDPGSIAVSKTENSESGKQSLEKFINEVSTGRLRKTWVTTGDLKHAVRDALDNVKATKPGVGWIRGDSSASAEILQEINEVRKENEKFRDAIGHLKVELALPPLPDADELLDIALIPLVKRDGYGGEWSGTYAKIRCTWISAFPIFYSSFQWRPGPWERSQIYIPEEDDTLRELGAAFAAEFASFETNGLFTVAKNTYDRLTSYYLETGLMTLEGEEPFTDAGKRLARRHRIAGPKDGAFEIVTGEIKCISSHSSSKLDDEIPF